MPLPSLAPLLLVAGFAAPHGGVFPPPPPPPPAPPEAANPGAAGPGIPGSGKASPPGTPKPVPGTPTSGPGATTPRDLFHWSHWWHLERDLYLWSPDRLRRPPVTGDADGAEVHGRPGDAVAVGVVLPRILALLETSRHDDVITACMVAAARIGSRMEPAERGTLVTALRARLAEPSLEVAETAAVCLGILGDARGLDTLHALLRDTKEAARAVGRGAVPDRIRAFAAYGLGLMAAGGDGIDVAGRQRAALALMDVVADDSVLEDLGVASVIALGLIGLPDTPNVPSAELREHPFALSVVHRGALARWMLERLAPKKGSKLSPRVQAHGVVALARVARDLEGTQRAAVLEALAKRGRSREFDQRTRAATWIALGEIATAGEEDAGARRALTEALLRGQPLERRFAAISLAWAGSRPGRGDEPFDGVAAVRKQLERRMAKGTEQDKTWAALALGVQSHALAERGVDGADAPARALMNLARRSSNASTVGAYALAAALAHVKAPAEDTRKLIEVIAKAVEKTGDPSSRGHVTIALGVLGATEAAAPLEQILSESTYQPEPLWSAAVSLHLVGRRDVSEILVDVLARAKSGVSRAAAAAALGRVGDERAVEPLLALMADETQIASARAFAVVGLGVLCDEVAAPWRVPIAHALPYVSAVPSLWGGGRGVLDIL